jgi:hypothetical protein
MARVPGGFGINNVMGVRRPDWSVSLERPLRDASTDMRLLERAAELAEELEEIVGRMPPGSFTQDPGMRAGDEFTDVGSPGYREQAKRVAERGGAKEYATSGEGEGAEARADTLRNRVGMALMALSGVAAVGGATRLGMASSQVGASPGIGRTLFNTPGARNTAANAAPSADRLSRLDYALDAMPAFQAVERFSAPLMAAPLAIPAYDMAQRYRRGARPFGPGE